METGMRWNDHSLLYPKSWAVKVWMKAKLESFRPAVSQAQATRCISGSSSMRSGVKILFEETHSQSMIVSGGA